MSRVESSLEDTAREALRDLASSLIESLKSEGRESDALRGTAFYDQRTDDIVMKSTKFAAASSAVASIPLVITRYGADTGNRLALQFIYELFPRIDGSTFDQEFKAVWQNFVDELNDPVWYFVGVANLRNFTNDSNTALATLGGASIRGRDLDELRALGFSASSIDGLLGDWMGFGASSFVLVVEKMVNKAPDNFLLATDASPLIDAIRLLGALRLAAPGDVSMGPMWLSRRVRFNIGHSGQARTGWSIPALSWGPAYDLTTEAAAEIPEVYRQLEQLEATGYGAGPGNLDLALRSFMTSFDRWPVGPDVQLIDAITAMEAILGTQTEITFRLAFRVAGLLSTDTQDRKRIFRAMKRFYDIRSKLVHGGKLKPGQEAVLKDVHELRGYSRRLLRAFVALAVASSRKYTPKFFTEELDEVLQDDDARSALQLALRLI